MNCKLFAAMMLTAAFLCPQVVQAQISPVFESGPSDSALFDMVINLPDDQVSLNGEISPSFITTQVNLQPGGSIDDDFTAIEQVEINVNGGSIGNRFVGIVGVEVNLNSGSIGDGFFALLSEVNISGGSIGDDFNALGSQVNIFGSEFFLDGAPLTSLVPGQAFTIDQFNFDSVLSGTLLDGSPLDLALSGVDTEFDTGSTLTVTVPIPEPTSTIALLAALGGFVARRRRS